MNPMLFAIPNQRKPLPHLSQFGHTERPIADNSGMEKLSIRQILTRNLRDAMKKAGWDQKKLAAAAGISESHVSEVMREISVPTIELVARFANALKLQAWELLADSVATRQAAMARLLWGQGVTNEKVEQHSPLPPVEAPPKKEARTPRKKAQGGPPRSGGAPRDNRRHDNE
jgi:transcriptional regulator with XRE-family HTH domain